MLQGYRTIVFTLIMAALTTWRVLDPTAELPDETAINGAVDTVLLAITTVWGVGAIILRAVTKTPLGKKPDDYL